MPVGKAVGALVSHFADDVGIGSVGSGCYAQFIDLLIADGAATRPKQATYQDEQHDRGKCRASIRMALTAAAASLGIVKAAPSSAIGVCAIA